MSAPGSGRPLESSALQGDALAQSRKGDANPASSSALDSHATLALDAIAKPSARAAWQVIEDEAVILDLEARRIMGLNATGSLAWTLMDGKRTVHEIALAVAEKFAQPTERVEPEVAGFLSSLYGRGLVEI